MNMITKKTERSSSDDLPLFFIFYGTEEPSAAYKAKANAIRKEMKKMANELRKSLHRFFRRWQKPLPLGWSNKRSTEENEEFLKLFYKSFSGLSSDEHKRFVELDEKAM